MAGMSAAAQLLGLPGHGDLSADELKKRQKSQNPMTAMGESATRLMQTYGKAASDLLSIGKDVNDAVYGSPAKAAKAAEEATKKRK